MRRSGLLLSVSLGSVLLTAGCTSFEPKPVETTLDGPKIVSNTASMRNTFIMARDSSLVVCSEPQPDAAFSQNSDVDISVSLIAAGGDKGGDGDEGSEESEMAGRSPSVLLARELLYRLCEFSRNYKLERETAVELYKQNLDIIREISGKESERTTIKIADTVTNSDTVTVDQRAAPGRARRAPVERTRSPFDSGSSYNTSPYNSNTYNSNSYNSSSSSDADF